MRHYAAILVVIAGVITASADVIPVKYAGISSAVVAVLYALAGIKQYHSNKTPGNIVG